MASLDELSSVARDGTKMSELVPGSETLSPASSTTGNRLVTNGNGVVANGAAVWTNGAGAVAGDVPAAGPGSVDDTQVVAVGDGRILYLPTRGRPDPTTGTRWAKRAARIALPALDTAALVAAFLATGLPAGPALAYGVLVLGLVAASGDYRSRISPSLADSLRRLLGQLALPLVPVAAVAGDATALELVRAAPAAMVAVVAGRAVSFAGIRWARRRGLIVEPTLIIGAGKQAVRMAKTLQAHPEYGLVPIGFLDRFDEDLDPPIVGDVDVLDSVLAEFAVCRVIVAFGFTREAEMVQVLRSCDHRRVEVHVLPRFFELGVAPQGPDSEDIWGIPLVRVKRAVLRTAAWRTKRVFDVILSSVALVLTAPVMLAVAVGVRLSDPGPILFRQRRVGQRGRSVDVLKFRSCPVNHDDETTWTVDGDAGVTRFGRFLRRTSLDELPQLFNVLRGDMSLVGPRPERPFFADRFALDVPRYGDRHRVPVGVTGWAQVHGLRGDTSIEERARFDNHYIEHWSLWSDIVILLRTVVAMWRRPGGRK